MNMHAVVVNNPSFGEANGSTVYLTDDLYTRLTESQGAADGPDLSSLRGGRALRGLKHLMERVRAKRGSARLVLTLGSTRKDGNDFFVNFDDYRQNTQRRFYEMYRQVGLEASLGFLGRNFPEDFELEGERLPDAYLRTARQNIPEIVQHLVHTTRSQPVLMESVASELREIASQRRLLRKESEALTRLRSQSNVLYYKEVLHDLEQRLTSGKPYSETRGKNSWQKWIFRNSWLFGPLYLEAIEKERVGLASIPDFLFPTLDGFIDILEIKLPNVAVIREDPSRRNVYTWSPDVNKAIGQVVNYVHEIDLHQLELSKNLSREYAELFGSFVSVIRPRAFILIGTEEQWNDKYREAHRRLNYSLHGIEVITYNELMRRGKRVIDLYADET